MIKIKLPTEKLVEFVSLTKSISTERNKLLPILDYIRVEIEFGSCTITKTNSNSFVKFDFLTNVTEDCSFLLHSDKLNLICTTAKGQEVQFDIEGQSIKIKDNKKLNFKCNSGGYDLDDFPIIPSNQKTPVLLETELIKSLSDARIYAATDTLRPAFLGIYSTGEYVYACNYVTIYTRRFSKEVPKIAMTEKEASLISSFDSVNYERILNYNTYKIGNVMYGFILPDGLDGFDYDRFLSDLKYEDSISISVDDFLEFCNATIAFTDSDFNISDIQIDGNECVMSFEDKERDESNVMRCPVIVVGGGCEFSFNPNIWLKLLKSFPYKEIVLSEESGNRICVRSKNDGGYIGIVSKYNKQ